MHIKNKNSIMALMTYVLLCFSTGAAVNNGDTMANQNEQDRARKDALAPQQQEYRPAESKQHEAKITFPDEEQCKYINEVIIESDDNKHTDRLLKKLMAEAKGKCLGVNGFKLLARKMQNELIAKGYITSLIDIPSQSLKEGILHLTLTYGKIEKVTYSDDKNDTTQLWNSLPTGQGERLYLPDLEQGMANLQRIPGSAAHMKILPGEQQGESDIEITRKAGKPWQLGVWLNDAGSQTSGRYQAGAALYLYNLTSLNDIFYISAGGDVEFNKDYKGNNNSSIYYSIPFGYWDLSLYASQSEYLQQFKGQWSTTDYKSENRYYSATLSRLLSHTRSQKTSADIRVFKSNSHYYFGGTELAVMRKSTPGLEVILRHQHYFDKKIVDVSLGLQNRFGWISSSPTPEEKTGLYDKYARVVHVDLQSLMKFDITGDKFSYAPYFSAQLSPDRLSSDNTFNIGNRWTVRGFDGERTLSSSQGWFLRNDFIWDLPVANQQFYIGIDAGRIIGNDRYQEGKVLSGAVSGLRGNLLQTQYDLFIGTPLAKPDSFQTNSLNLGFSLQRRF